MLPCVTKQNLYHKLTRNSSINRVNHRVIGHRVNHTYPLAHKKGYWEIKIKAKKLMGSSPIGVNIEHYSCSPIWVGKELQSFPLNDSNSIGIEATICSGNATMFKLMFILQFFSNDILIIRFCCIWIIEHEHSSLFGRLTCEKDCIFGSWNNTQLKLAF